MKRKLNVQDLNLFVLLDRIYRSDDDYFRVFHGNTGITSDVYFVLCEGVNEEKYSFSLVAFYLHGVFALQKLLFTV